MNRMTPSDVAAGPFRSEAEAAREAARLNAERGGTPFPHPIAGMDELCEFMAVNEEGTWWTVLFMHAEPVV
jgi:hypothetical protein